MFVTINGETLKTILSLNLRLEILKTFVKEIYLVLPIYTTYCLKNHAPGVGYSYRKMVDVIICSVQNAAMNFAGSAFLPFIDTYTQ